MIIDGVTSQRIWQISFPHIFLILPFSRFESTNDVAATDIDERTMKTWEKTAGFLYHSLQINALNTNFRFIN
jgi:hypothetical protein